MNISNVIAIVSMAVAAVSAFFAYQFSQSVSLSEIQEQLDRTEARVDAHDGEINSLTSRTLSLDAQYVETRDCAGGFVYIGPSDARAHGGFCVRIKEMP